MADTVTNTSPLIYLYRLGRLHLLQLLFGHVIVPVQVHDEIIRGSASGHTVPDLQGEPWIEIRRAAVEHDYEDLGPGECGALDLARALPDAFLILDDGAARIWAARLGIRCAGTVGVLIEGKRLGHLARLAPELDRLTVLGFRMGSALRKLALVEAGEG